MCSATCWAEGKGTIRRLRLKPCLCKTAAKSKRNVNCFFCLGKTSSLWMGSFKFNLLLDLEQSSSVTFLLQKEWKLQSSSWKCSILSRMTLLHGSIWTSLIQLMTVMVRMSFSYVIQPIGREKNWEESGGSRTFLELAHDIRFLFWSGEWKAMFLLVQRQAEITG